MTAPATSRWKPYPVYKDSGVEWLEKVPAQWHVKRLKWCVSEPITDGPHSTPEFCREGVPFLSVDNIQDGRLVFENCRFVSPEDHELFKKKAFPRKDDILIGKAASTGKIARVIVSYEFSIWSPLATLPFVILPLLSTALKALTNRLKLTAYAIQIHSKI